MQTGEILAAYHRQSPAWQSVLTMVEAGEGISLLPSCVQRLHSQDVIFKPLNNRGCEVDVVLAWRTDEPDATRDGFVDLLRGSRSEIERLLRQK